MKIEVNKRGTKEFYSEILYITTKYNILKKKPNKKVQSIIKNRIIQIVVISLLLPIYVDLYIKTNQWIYMFIIGAFFLIIFCLILTMININKRINILINEKGTKTISIDEEKVSYKDESKEYNVKWENIETIIINKESISFLPKTILYPVISLPTEYKDKVIETISKYKKESLLVDNSDKYKK